jgi:hypothetical protein
VGAVFLTISVSLDGFAAGPNGLKLTEPSRMVMDEALASAGACGRVRWRRPRA